VTAVTDRTCARCATPLTASSTGRPPSYCSTRCRRAAEYELRRLQRRLETAERERDRWHRAVHHPAAFGHNADYARRHLAAFTDEAERLSARLVQLVGDGDDGPAVTP